MTNNTIKHLGIVENIQGSHLSVRIVQTSACAACGAKGHCSSADSKDKIIDIIDTAASSYRGREGNGGRRNVDGHDGGIVGVCTSFRTSYILIVSFDGFDGE